MSLSQRLHRIPRMYSTEYDPGLIDDDTANLMKMSAVRCPQGVELVKRRHRADTARDLVYSLPLQRPQQPERFKPWIRAIFGTIPYDPMKRFRPRNRAKRY